MKTIFTLLFLFYSFISSSQVERKLSHSLKERMAIASGEEPLELSLSVTSIDEFKKQKPAEILYQYGPAQVLVIRIKRKDLDSLVLSKQVLFADVLRKPVEELLVGNYDLGTNKVNVVHHLFPGVNGNSLMLSVKENRPDSTDIDLHGRYVSTTLSSPLQSLHANIMSTIAAGGENSFYQGKGAAWGSSISSSSFASLLPDADAAYRLYNISVQNHSYGTAIENFYGADARAYDQSSINVASLLHVFSAGNSGTQTSTTGPYANVSGYANLTGSFKMAKNIITVGHTDSAGNILAPSSKGPAHDGRVKPELVAFGEDGSSGAAALVSGTGLLLQQAFKDANGSLPNSTLVKGVLLNSADDVGSQGIDFRSGYGSLNAIKAIRTLTQQNFISGSVSNGADQNYTLTVPPGTRKLKIMLVWADPAAAANAAKALINDLDLELQLPANGTTWLPWVLSSFPHIDSLTKLPVRKRDTLNNVEQVTLDTPVSGSYNIKVHGSSVTGGPQQFFIIWQIDPADTFEWYYPTGSDPVISADTNYIRWNSTFTSSSGQLEYTLDGTNWITISNNIDLATGYYPWGSPGVFSAARLRMNIAGNPFISDTFIISRPLNTRVGFNCPDSFLFSWEKISNISSYQVFRLGNKFLEPFQVVSDSFVVIAKNQNQSYHYAVAPILAPGLGVKSYTFDYRTQGVGCYVKNFFATLVGNSGLLELELGTNYRIQNIIWEKLTTSRFISLQTISPVTALSYSFNDMNLTKGLNSYRVKIELQNGQIVYSNIETIQFFSNSNYIVLPNPIQHNQQLTFISKDVNGEILQVFNSNGMKVLEIILDDTRKTISTSKLSKGIYFGRIPGKPDVIKFIVY